MILVARIQPIRFFWQNILHWEMLIWHKYCQHYYYYCYYYHIIVIVVIRMSIIDWGFFVVIIPFYIPRRKREFFSSLKDFQNVKITVCVVYLYGLEKMGVCLPKEEASGMGVPALRPLRGPRHLLYCGGYSTEVFMFHLIASRINHYRVIKFFLILLEGILMHGRNS